MSANRRFQFLASCHQSRCGGVTAQGTIAGGQRRFPAQRRDPDNLAPGTHRRRLQNHSRMGFRLSSNSCGLTRQPIGFPVCHRVAGGRQNKTPRLHHQRPRRRYPCDPTPRGHRRQSLRQAIAVDQSSVPTQRRSRLSTRHQKRHQLVSQPDFGSRPQHLCRQGRRCFREHFYRCHPDVCLHRNFYPDRDRQRRRQN